MTVATNWLYQRHDKGFSNLKDDGLDVLAITGNLFGAGWMRQASLQFNSAQQGLKAGKYLLFGQIGSDGASGIILTAEALNQIDEIKDSSHLTTSQKTRQISELIRSLALVGAMTMLSLKGAQADLVHLKSGQPDVVVKDPELKLTSKSSDKVHQGEVDSKVVERLDNELEPSVVIYQTEAKTVNELIDSDLDLSYSLNNLQGAEFKDNAIINYQINPYTASLTQDEYLSLHVYTTNLYIPINKGLRGLSPEDKIKWTKVSSDTDAALVKLSEHQDLGFKSSSYNLSKPFEGNTLTKIKSKSGVKIDDISVMKEEEEVLFRPNTKFRVLARRKVGVMNYVTLEEI